jgi:hypothetical protein
LSVLLYLKTSSLGGVRLSPLVTLATIWPAPEGRWWWVCSSWWNEKWQGKRSTPRKLASATLSTTNPTRPDFLLNPGRHGGKLVTNHLSYGMTLKSNKHFPSLQIIIRLLDTWQ